MDATPMQKKAKHAAVLVQNAFKCYSSGVPVLQNFNMTVPQGTIYSLLGSSGCGKTTMLSCIVGIRKLDAGDIFVLGQRPGSPESGIPGRSVGYMPQDIALYPQLTIREMLEYFGRIYDMTQTEIDGRIAFLSNFLDLPPASRKVSTLSGGQQRRTSLATCLLHEPPLLILDEPTVGVDPLLRESIWEYLYDLVAKKGTSVIITTHYIEEARTSQTIGLMRNGRLLIEKSPSLLLQEHNTDLLEDIVLKLCKNELTDFKPSSDQSLDEVSKALAESSFYAKKKKFSFFSRSKAETNNTAQSNQNSVVGLKFKQTEIDENQNRNDDSISHSPIKTSLSLTKKAGQKVTSRFNKVKAVATRNTLILLRVPVFLLAVFIMPSLQLLVTNYTIGPLPKHMRMGIIDPEINNNLSECTIVNALNEKCSTDKLSCKYFNSFPEDIILPVSMDSISDALEATRNGQTWGYMSFPKNFSVHLTDRAVSGMYAENQTIDGTTISIKIDNSHYYAAALLTKTIYESYQNFIIESLKECDQDASKAMLPINYRKPIYGTLDMSFQEFTTPGVLMIMLFLIPYLTCSCANITDRKQGTLDRSMVAGVSMIDIILGYMITEGVVIFIQAMISYLTIAFLFQLQIQGSVVAFLALIILTAFSGFSFGFFIAQLCTEEAEALIVGIGCYLPNMILAGLIWPLESAPLTIRIIGHCLPVTWAISAIRSIMSRGWPVTHKYVWPGFAVVLIWIMLAWFLTFLVRRSQNRR